MKNTAIFPHADELRGRLEAICGQVRNFLENQSHGPGSAPSGKDAPHTGYSDELMPRRVELRRANKTILKVSPSLALLALLLGLKKPRLILLGGAAICLTRTDLAVVCPNFDFSVKDTLFSQSKAAAGNVQDMKERLDDRFHELKEQTFHRESEAGQRYFTIKL